MKMGVADKLEILTTLLTLVIGAEDGEFLLNCPKPLKCVPFAECSAAGQKGSDIIFRCDGSKRDGNMWCCHPAPLSSAVHGDCFHSHEADIDIPNTDPVQMPVSQRFPKPAATRTPAYPSNGLTKPLNASSSGYAHSRNETEGSHKIPNNATPSHNGFLSPNRDSDNFSKITPIPSSFPDPQQTNKPASTNSSRSPSTFAAPGCCDQSLDQKMKLVPLDDCGLSTTLRITNGHNASFGQFPWMALLGYRLRDGTLSFLCGGTLINKRYVLTAAHCLEPDGAVLEEVRLGELNLETEPDCDHIENYCADPAVDIPIETAIRHENFNHPYLKNDIALLRLQMPINTSTEYIRPICLPFGLNVTGLEEKKYQVAGWGKTNYHDVDSSPLLQFAGILSMPLEDCDSRQEKEVRPLDETQFCAGVDMGKDACKGDSGGPLMETLQAPSQSYVQTFQIGIVSFGSVPCGANYSPSVYTRVTAYLDWILNNIEP